MYKTALFLMGVIIITSCSTKMRYQKDSDEAIKHIKSNMEFLTSDDIQGREASTFGGYAAGQFITSQLKQYGIKSFGEDGYFQKFELQSISYQGSQIILQGVNNTDSLKYLEHYYIYTPGDSTESTPIVYVGYGIIDSVNNINDYENIDVRGKTVLVLRGVPEGYKGPRGAGWTRSKSRTAEQAGAIGCIALFSGETMQKEWSEEIARMKEERIGRVSTRTYINTIIPDSTTTKKLFDMPTQTYAGLVSELQNGLLKNGTELNKKITWNINKIKKARTARNIIGILPGKDPVLDKEYVTLGAHYDHEGIKGGVVFNGADDNGSGTTALLECARQLATKKQNKRPVLFCFWDAEEKGLLGSDYYAGTFENIKEILVNINLDMVGRESEDSLAVIGSGKLSSELFHIVEKANKETANFIFDYTFDDENHPERLYYRSDHWSFARLGVPSVFLFDANDKDYHTPRDDADRINYVKIEKVVDLATRVASEVANLDHKLRVDNANISGLDVQK